MSTSADYAAFVCEQISPYGECRSRKMFGDYMVYLNDKPVLLVCDSTVFVKKLPETDALLAHAPSGIPYEGAKPHYMLDIENRKLLDRLMPVLEAITPLPRKKKSTSRS
ncbi:TfoX/Sxy family protein [Ruminococcus sp.]|uniref:TfoX/Sxy family protein n=1 Tax=Ruminococcus sp. TaxID=41978 RepID=UPI0025F260CC|nr:TfoX/Sxy family protein [Ruminococcus sp.]MCI5815634.1 TfoX/Sxy family protein [Ruminococcus sp.]